MSAWPRAAIGELVEIRGGGTPRRDNEAFFQGSIPWVTPKDMKAWEVKDSQVRITREAIEQSATRMIDADSVLVVVRSGILKHSLPVAINRVPVAINQDMKALTCSPRIDPRYLARQLQANEATVLSWVRATTADNFPVESLRALEIPLPPLSEQRRIAAILDEADALRAKRRAALAQLDEMARAIFVEMFGSSAELEARWGMEELGPLLEFLTSGSRGWAAHYADQGDLFLRIQNVRRDELDLSDVAFVKAPSTAEARRTKVEPGDVLLSITADLGRTAVIPSGIGLAFINQHLAILRTKRLHSRFLSAYLASPLGQEQVLKRNRQGVKAGLNFDDIRSVAVPAVPLPLQQQFAARLEQADELRRHARSDLGMLDSLFASLQHRAFRGEL